VASAGTYVNLNLSPDNHASIPPLSFYRPDALGFLPPNHPTTQFLQAGCPSCRPTNSVKALKAINEVK